MSIHANKRKNVFKSEVLPKPCQTSRRFLYFSQLFMIHFDTNRGWCQLNYAQKQSSCFRKLWPDKVNILSKLHLGRTFSFFSINIFTAANPASNNTSSAVFFPPAALKKMSSQNHLLTGLHSATIFARSISSPHFRCGDLRAAGIGFSVIVDLVSVSEGEPVCPGVMSAVLTPASAVATLKTAQGLFIAYSSRVCLWPAVRAASLLWWKTLGPSHPFHICSNQLFNRTAN